MASYETSVRWMRANCNVVAETWRAPIISIARRTINWIINQWNDRTALDRFQRRLDEEGMNYQIYAYPDPLYFKTRIHSVRILHHRWRSILLTYFKLISRNTKRMVMVRAMEICKEEILQLKRVLRETNQDEGNDLVDREGQMSE